MELIVPDQANQVPRLPVDPRLYGLLQAAHALQPRTVALRRQLHKHPELGLELPPTK